MLALAAFLPGPVVVPWPWNLMGWGAVLAGVLLHMRASVLFRRRGTTRAPRGRPRELVTGGPFGWTRNPMYLAGVLILGGLAVTLARATPFLVVPAFGGWVFRDYIVAEERVLQDHFGEEYATYRSRVRRWIGRRA